MQKEFCSLQRKKQQIYNHVSIMSPRNFLTEIPGTHCLPIKENDGKEKEKE